MVENENQNHLFADSCNPSTDPTDFYTATHRNGSVTGGLANETKRKKIKTLKRAFLETTVKNQGSSAWDVLHGDKAFLTFGYRFPAQTGISLLKTTTLVGRRNVDPFLVL